MTEILWRPHHGQREVHLSDARFKVLACGRRWGKSLLGLMELLVSALEKKGLYWWISSFYKLLIPVSNLMREWVPEDFINRKLEASNVVRYIELANGSEIYFHSADREDSLRGSGLDGLVVDEAASMRGNRWEEELRPSLIDRKGWAIFISTPKSRNWFYEIYLKGQDSVSWPDWESWSYPSHVNPYLPKDELVAIKKGLPELTYRQEILAEFIESEGILFRNLDSAIAGSLGPAEAGRRYFLGVDLAKTQDFTVLTAIDDLGHLRGFDRFRQLDWTFQKRKITSFAKRYSGLIWIDSTGVGDPIYDDLKRAGLKIKSYKFTTTSKRQLIENLTIAFDEGKFTIPDDPEVFVLLNELKAFTYEITPSNRIHYGAPEGLHDDCVIAFALAAWGQNKSRRQRYWGEVF